MRESPDSFSDGMFVSNKEWNAAYTHDIFMFYARQGGGGTLTVFICYGMNTGSGAMG